MRKKTNKRNQEAGVLNDDSLFYMGKYNRRNIKKNVLVISVVTLLIGIIISSSIISARTIYTQKLSKNTENIKSQSITKYMFIGLVHDLKINDNELTCYAVILIIFNLSIVSPKIVSIYFHEEYITLEKPILFFQKNITLNRTVIFGICDGCILG
jgi:hypothetical protein